jgi:hypothetical protein
MKKTLIALAALAATSAFAQSSVTLSGSINYGVATAVTGIHSYGGWKGDRNHVTFGAVEDLGGGLKVTALAQLRYNSATSAQSTSYVETTTGARGDNLFEQTSVAVDSSFGQVRMGRFTNAVGVAPLHPFEDSGQSTASHQAANGRLSGQIQYVSPMVAGFQVFAFNAQKSANKFLTSNGAGYANTWTISVPNLATNQTDATRWANANSVGINYSNGPVYAQYYTLTDMMGLKSSKIAASYDLGVAKLFANQFKQNSNQVFSTTAAAGAVGMKAHNATELAASVPMGAFTFTLGRYNANKDLDLSKTDGSTKVARTAWGANYSLSKRTTVIYVASSTSNGSANAQMATGKNQFLGLQHTF